MLEQLDKLAGREPPMNQTDVRVIHLQNENVYLKN